jgi:diacylglycerol kinase family enzyme
VYLAAGLISLVRIGLPRLRLRVDGAVLRQTHRSLHVCNMRTYGKGWAMAPAAHHQSGLLHYQARKRGDLVSFLLHILAAARCRPAPAFVSTYGGGAPLRMEADRPVPVQIDGDDAGDATRLELRIRPAAALMVAPAGKQ